MSAGSTPLAVTAIDVTTELRWFFDGALPPEVLSWFTGAGSRGFHESRCDSYRDNGLIDIGVKRRCGTTLELKERLCLPELVVLDGVGGQLETWQRWSPADDRVELAAGTVWVEVDKTVIKRRFDINGSELTLSEETRGLSGQGCDAEIVEVVIGGSPGWSIAFAGFGPRDRRRDSVFTAWHELMSEGTLPADIDFGRSVPYGYPEWLAGVRGHNLLTL